MDEGKLDLRHDPGGILQRLYNSKPKDATASIGRSNVCGGENGVRETREGLGMRNSDDELPVRGKGCGCPYCQHCRSGHVSYDPRPRPSSVLTTVNIPHVAFTSTVFSRHPGITRITPYNDGWTVTPARRDDGHPVAGELSNLQGQGTSPDGSQSE